MAVGMTLTRLLDDYRAEARLSQNPASNIQLREGQVKMLQRIQETLWEDYTWPDLRVRRDVELQAGQRYYEPPEDMQIGSIEGLFVWYNGEWLPVEANIPMEAYTAYNSDLDERSWPVTRWQIYEDGQIEFWPVPDQNADTETREGVLRFVGKRNLNPLVEPNDRCDIDGRLITLYAAAETLAANGAKDAPLKLDRANALLRRLRAKQSPARQFQMFGVGERPLPRKAFIGTYRPPVHY